MLFNKNTLLALLAMGPAVSANTNNLRVARDLTACPENPSDVNLQCTLYKNGNQQAIAYAGKGDSTVNAGIYDPEACYNINCSMADSINFVKFSYSGATHDAWNAPYWLAGGKSGNGCKDLSPSCEDAKIVAKAINHQRREDLVCDQKAFVFECPEECNTCPGDLIPVVDCPKTPDDCGCPAGEIPIPGTNKCKIPCPPTIDHPPLDKCELKDEEVKLEFDTKFKKIPSGYKIEFESFERDDNIYTFHVSTGEYDKPEDNEYDKFYLPTPGMKWDNKDIDEKEFAMRFIDENGCPSRPFECNNKNLTPLGLDLDKSGEVETIRGEFEIDLTGDHFPEMLDTWFAPTEGILINTAYGLENGVNGEHLFGDMGGAFKNGFAKLAVLDVNGDGIISGNELSTLAIWRDANSNAALDEGEMSTWESYGIVSLSVSHKHLVSSAMLEDGSMMKVEDLYFTTVKREAIV